MADVYDFEVDQGSAHATEFQYTDANDAPIDITGYLIRFKARQPRNTGTVVLEGDQTNIVPITDAAAGKFTLTLTSVQAAALDWGGAAFYDIELVPSGVEANAFRFVEGEVRLSREQTYT